QHLHSLPTRRSSDLRLHENRSARFKVSHLRYASLIRTQYQLTVKVHRVFPSYCGQAASSPPLQFRRDPLRDSRSVVTRFVQVGRSEEHTSELQSRFD